MNSGNKDKTVAYSGHCAFAVSTGKIDIKGGKHSLTIEGKTYLFSNPIAKFLFKLIPNRIEKADINWKNK
ncbi:hypothetical protein ATE84_4921 [Aquimarina sp. MAR_2010_214]|uniref:hypothetical protein n=1 Tax=Aquimarina sp. MAR_2010_214 TaxID=1250026 RepID=UPI000C70B60C|nr:hypothetical protein [Aquimarina sp. MAR_2010_214]PKV52794.1 hypothetical protein ATE84_4921 [Aquimarina sp. MAR_2010_214]